MPSGRRESTRKNLLEATFGIGSKYVYNLHLNTCIFIMTVSYSRFSKMEALVLIWKSANLVFMLI